MKRSAPDFPLELVFVEKSGRRERPLSDMPVRITDADGRVVCQRQSAGPLFRTRLPKGRYMVSTRWDACSPSRPLVMGEGKQRLVFAWPRRGDQSAPVPESATLPDPV
jgi:hypothetical protein